MIFIKNKERRRMLTRCLLEGFYFTVSAGLSFLVLWWFLPLWLSCMLLSVVMVHEMGHYLTAAYHGYDVWLPFFVAIVVGVIGGTYVATDDPEERIKFQLAGPLAGGLACAAWGAAALISGFPPAVFAALWSLLSQILTAIVGGDGRKHRRYKRVIAEARAGWEAGQGSTIPA